VKNILILSIILHRVVGSFQNCLEQTLSKICIEVGLMVLKLVWSFSLLTY